MEAFIVPFVCQEYSLQDIVAGCVETKEFRPRETKNFASVKPGLRGVFVVVFDAVSIILYQYFSSMLILALELSISIGVIEITME